MKQNYYLIYFLVFCFIFAVSGNAGAFAFADQGKNSGTIEVYGEAELEIAPDQAKVSVGVETEDTDAEKAVSENAKLMNAVLAAAEEFSSSTSSISTGSYQVRPIRRDDETIYRVLNELRISLEDLEQLGKLIDVLVSAGANRVNSVQFEAADSDKVKLTALAKAVEQGKQKAKVLAQASGMVLGDVVSITEQSGSYTPYQLADTRALSVAAEAATDIRPENIKIRARIGMKYSIIPAAVNEDVAH